MEPARPILPYEVISQTIYIDQDSNKYPLHLNSIGDIINFNLEYNKNNYKIKISLKEIKNKESISIFSSYKSKDFMAYLKKLSKMKKIFLIKIDNIIKLKLNWK